MGTKRGILVRKKGINGDKDRLNQRAPKHRESKGCHQFTF